MKKLLTITVIVSVSFVQILKAQTAQQLKLNLQQGQTYSQAIVGNVDYNSNNEIESNFYRKHNSIYLGFAGTSASLFSLNYDRIIYNKPNWFLSTNIGVGFKDPDFDTHFTIPFGVNLNLGKTDHYMEIGIGLTYEYSAWNKDSFSRTLFACKIGYRYQRKTGGLFFKGGLTGVTPFFYFSDTRENNGSNFLKNIDLLPYILGLSVGYTF